MSLLGLGSSLSASGDWMSPMSEHFPDPFLDYASLAMPQSNAQVLRWCEFLFSSNGTYRQAVDRVLSYFITDVDISDCSDDERDKWKTFLEETIDIRNVLHVVGLDSACYGNSFTSILPGFKRYLSCPKCYLELPLSRVYNEPVFRFKWTNYQFTATCPKCDYAGKWRHIDRRSGEEGGFRIRRWNPHEIELLWDPMRDEMDYIWKIPEYYRKMIREGALYHLERANWEVIKAVRDGKHLLFDKDTVHHMREDALAGLNNRGWGISRVLANFRQAWYVQVLHRYNEAIALDYVIPFRVLTPVPGDKSTGADPLLNQNLGGFMSHVHRMIRERRRDPARWNTLPFPINYQALGGDATQLAPRELMDQGLETLLNSIGVPVEFYKGSLQVQAAPAALRLFEATWSSLPHNFNAFLRFIVRQLSRLLSWETVRINLTRVTHADDLQRQQTKLQLYTGGQISPTTGLKAVGVDYREEVMRMHDDEQFAAEQQAKLQERMEQKATQQQMAQPPQPGMTAGAPPAGAPPAGAPPAGAPADPSQMGPAGMAAQSVVASLPTGANQQITPEELLARAQYVATQVMGMPESQKDSELIKLKKMDPTLHAIVRSQMQDMKQQLQTQGGAMLQAQMFGKAGASQEVSPTKKVAARKPRSPRRSVLLDESDDC